MSYITTTPLTAQPPDSWIARNWRPLCALVYLVVCLWDFAVMPTYCQWVAQHRNVIALLETLSHFQNGAAQLQALNTMVANVWQPVTLQAAGLFHMAFAAILGVSAWTRGQEKVARINARAMPVLAEPVLAEPLPTESHPAESHPV